VLREQEDPFLRAGGTEVERLAGERPEVFILAVGIGAPDTGGALGIVAAENELLHHLGDALEAKTPVDDRMLGLVLIREVLKMLFFRLISFVIISLEAVYFGLGAEGIQRQGWKQRNALD
jgi:hypothetical protein